MEFLRKLFRGEQPSKPEDAVQALREAPVQVADGGEPHGWTKMSCPTTENLVGIWGSSIDNIFAVSVHAIYHYDGREWTFAYKAKDKSDRFKFLAIHGSGPDNIFVVGGVPNNGVVLHYDGTTWREHSSPTAQRIGGVWTAGSPHLVIFGEDSSLPRLHDEHQHPFEDYRKLYWKEQNPKFLDEYSGWDSLRAAWGFARDKIVAVGDKGLILHYDGDSWVQVPGPNQETLTGVWGASMGLMEKPHHRMTHDLYGVWGTCPEDVLRLGKTS